MSINQNLLHPAFHSPKIFNFFFFSAIRFWNKIPVTAKILVSVSKFKKYLMKHIFENPLKFCALLKPKVNR